MQTLLWYRFQTIWKQMKVVLICMGVLAGAVLLFALIGGAAAWEAESIDFCTAVDGFGRNWLFFYFRPDEWFPF